MFWHHLIAPEPYCLAKRTCADPGIFVRVGVQMLISIETYRNCDFPVVWGSGSPIPARSVHGGEGANKKVPDHTASRGAV